MRQKVHARRGRDVEIGAIKKATLPAVEAIFTVRDSKGYIQMGPDVNQADSHETGRRGGLSTFACNHLLWCC